MKYLNSLAFKSKAQNKLHTQSQACGNRTFFKDTEYVCSVLTLYDPVDGSPAGPTVPGIIQAGILAWVAISCSRGYS